MCSFSSHWWAAAPPLPRSLAKSFISFDAIYFCMLPPEPSSLSFHFLSSSVVWFFFFFSLFFFCCPRHPPCHSHHCSSSPTHCHTPITHTHPACLFVVRVTRQVSIHGHISTEVWASFGVSHLFSFFVFFSLNPYKPLDTGCPIAITEEKSWFLQTILVMHLVCIARASPLPPTPSPHLLACLHVLTSFFFFFLPSFHTRISRHLSSFGALPHGFLGFSRFSRPFFFWQMFILLQKEIYIHNDKSLPQLLVWHIF